MTLNIADVISQITSKIQSTGLFDRVNAHEPKNAPGNGLSAAVWVATVSPAIGQSGLAATTARVVFSIRVYSNMVQEPQDKIDENLIQALDVVFTSFSRDFDLGGNVRDIDLLGHSGTPLQAQAGYLDQDGKKFRTFVITLPVVINDVWTQVS